MSLPGNGRNGNGNGREAHPETPLEELEQRISLTSEGETVLEENPLGDWASRKNPTPEDLREGLIIVAKTAEAAIEANLKNAQTVRMILDRVKVIDLQLQSIGAKTELTKQASMQFEVELESSARQLFRVGGQVEDLHKKADNLQHHVEAVPKKSEFQALESRVISLQEKVALLPAMKELLAEILAKLP